MDLAKQNASNSTQPEVITEVSLNVVVFTITVGLILMLLNGLVICCGITYRTKLNNAYSLHILSLSVSDFIVGCAVVPMAMTFKMAEFGPCVASFAVFLSAQCASLCHVLGICLHRCFTVMFKNSPGPARSSHKAVMACIGLTWLICPAVASIPFVVFVQTKQTVTQCSPNGVFGDNYGQAVATIAGILLVPLLLTDGCYAIFICYLKHRRRGVGPTTTTTRIRLVNVEGLKTDIPMKREERRSTADKDIPVRSPGNPNMLDPLNESSKGQRGVTNSDSPVASTSTGQTETVSNRHTTIQTHQSFTTGHEPKRPLSHRPTTSTSTTGGRLPRTTTGPIPAQTTAIKTIGVLLLVLNVCTLPLLLTFLVEALNEDIRLSRNVKFMLLSLMMLNAGLNPVVYTVKMRTFRMCLVQMLKKFARRIRRIFECCLP